MSETVLTPGGGDDSMFRSIRSPEVLLTTLAAAGPS
jgi:hypothetical protein